MHQRDAVAAHRLGHEVGRDEDRDARPRATARPAARQKPSRATGSTPEVGSSRIRISGSWISATASDRRWRMPSGRASGQLVGHARELEPLEHQGHPGGDPLGRQAEQPRVQDEVLADGELAVEREAPGSCSRRAGASRDRCGRDRPAEQRWPRPSWPAAGRSASSSSWSCRSRWSRESRRSRRGDAEADMVDRDEVAEAAGQALGLDRRRSVACDAAAG